MELLVVLFSLPVLAAVFLCSQYGLVVGVAVLAGVLYLMVANARVYSHPIEEVTVMKPHFPKKTTWVLIFNIPVLFLLAIGLGLLLTATGFEKGLAGVILLIIGGILFYRNIRALNNEPTPTR